MSEVSALLGPSRGSEHSGCSPVPALLQVLSVLMEQHELHILGGPGLTSHPSHDTPEELGSLTHTGLAPEPHQQVCFLGVTRAISGPLAGTPGAIYLRPAEVVAWWEALWSPCAFWGPLRAPQATCMWLASCLPLSSLFVYLETPPDALILESPFTNIREEAKSHPFSVASTDFIKN